MSVFIINEDTELDDDNSQAEIGGSAGISSGPTATQNEAHQALANFWPKVTKEINSIQNLDVRCQALPLARIKKIMKLDEDVKMISGEAPVLFAKAAELFIQELTLRAWIHTEDNKRRTLQRNDIAMAVSKFDQFDFLIDIVPRDEAKQPSNPSWRGTLSPDQVNYYFQVNQQPQTIQTTADGTSAGAATVTAVQAPQVMAQQMMAADDKGTVNLSNANFQLVQQIISPTGEIQQIPLQIPANQANLIRMQLQTNGTGQPIILQQPQLIQVTQGGQGGGPVFIQATGAQSNS
ncbi:Nuclear transcription factor Y [Nesidiocoris tenuis]|nr:Nuclear transcription factor Y [Nesidiocoris tenuis]